jgi:glycosyltransferase involved in cell wall biosynthesis
MISVIIPTLNEESTIEKLLSQFSDELVRKYEIELILSDGGSTDRTVEMARKKVHIVLDEMRDRKQTIGEGRNRGASHSSGDVLFFFNADVKVDDMEQYLKTMLEAIESLDAVAATCPVFVYPEEETLLDRLYHRIHNLHVRLLNGLGFGTGRGECQVIKRGVFFGVGGYDERLAAGEDFDLYRRLTKRGKIKYVSDLAVYESPRRYRNSGYLRVTLLWFLNAVSIIVFHRSFSREWKPAR